MLSISKISLRELKLFNDDTGLSDKDFLPISKVRVMSLMANPRANSNDNVLYQAHWNEKLIAYLTVLPDIAYAKNQSIPFAWISGAWVHPSFRRQGIATKLIDAVVLDWKGMLMATNFSKITEAVFEKTKTFKTVKKIEGQRFFLRKTLLSSYNCCSHSNPITYITEKFINLLNHSNLTRKFLKIPKNIEIEYFTRPDDEILNKLTLATANTLTKRSTEEINWIIRYPWLINGLLPDRAAQKFFFASVIPAFAYYMVKVFKDDELIGVLLMQHSNTRFTVPYYWFESGTEDVMARVILLHASRAKASFINIYNQKIVNSMLNLRPYYFYSKKRTRRYLVTDSMLDIIGDNFDLMDGDGDCVFI